MNESAKNLENSIDDSLFLDPEKKMDLKPMLKTLSSNEQDKLKNILDSEKKDLSEIIKAHIEQNGEEGVENMDRAFSDAKKKINKESEALSQKKDELRMAKLEQQLEDS